ncbi:hypothetical protein ACFL03_13345 [Thermodesulfobacteriota bacterium]
MPVEPTELLRGPVGEWVIVILLCALFIAIAGVTLPASLTEKRYGKALITIVGLILGVGLYMAKDLYNFNLESFGFLAIALIIIVAMFVTYGLIKKGASKTVASAVTYCLMFLTFFLMTPSIFDSFAKSFPLLNLFFFLAFFFVIGKLILTFFKHPKDTYDSARDLSHANIEQPDAELIEREIDDEEKERKQVKHKTIRLTKRELREIDDISDNLKEIEKILKHSDAITEEAKNDIAQTLSKIGNMEADFVKGLNLLKQHVRYYRARDQNKIHELEKRLSQAKDDLKTHKIKKELHLEKKKLEIFEFINEHYDKIMKFLEDFDLQIQKAVIYIKENDPKGAVHPVQTARNGMNIIYHILKDFKKHEFYLLNLSKKEEKILKKEKKGK